jgi:hypothetical protein
MTETRKDTSQAELFPENSHWFALFAWWFILKSCD